MTSTPEQKPSSSWFSSLRRQAKPKQSKNNGKEMQKSCLELSTIAKDNTIVVDPLKIRRNQIFSRHYECPNGSVSKTIEIDHVKQISECDSGSDMVADGKRGKSDSEKCRNGSLNGEYKITTTHTKVIETTVITKQSHRVGLVFNDAGELISNHHLNCFPDLNINNKFNHLVNVCNNNNNNNYNASVKSSILDDDIQFIDDTSQSGSDGHINRIHHSKNKCSTCHNQNKSKSDWNLSTKKQVNPIVFYFYNIFFSFYEDKLNSIVARGDKMIQLKYLNFILTFVETFVRVNAFGFISMLIIFSRSNVKEILRKERIV